MPTIRFNGTHAGMFNMTLAGGILSTATSAITGDSLIFGPQGSGGGSTLYVFKGTPPSDFNTFTSISSRLSDLLIPLPLSNAVAISSTSTNVKYLVALTSGTSKTSGLNNQPTNFSRSSNVVTVVVSGSLPVDGLVPGQQITISGTPTAAASFAGTFTVQSVISALSFTFNQTGPNLTANGDGSNITLPFQAISSGTASWFCVCRTASPSWNPSTPFTQFGAAIGTVGVIGSGADLEIVSTNITAGTTYTSAGMYINIPLNWTF